jgi:3D-(3,5/4)-trihydroxycyclohexane-1,2-dione acylhydrolase (decyclizing)
MTTTIKLTAAQAMMRWLSVQMTEDGERFIEGVWAIFGHGSNIFVYRAASANGAWMEPR